jgi:hypothetical protein
MKMMKNEKTEEERRQIKKEHSRGSQSLDD